MKLINTYLLIIFPFVISIGQSTNVDFTIIGNESSEYSTDIDTLSGFLYLVGNTNECESNDGFIIKYKNDSIYKRKIIGTENIEVIESLETTNDDSIYVGGFTNLNNDYDVYLAQLDTQLNIIKTNTIELPNWNFCRDVVIGNNYLIGVGETHNNNDYDAFIFKVDRNLDTLWTKSLSVNKDQKLSKVIAYNDSIYIACGYTEIDGMSKDILLISFNANTGDTLWTNNYGGINDDFCNSIIKTNDGGIAGFGTTSSYVSTSEDYMIFKTNSLGYFEWSRLHYTQTGIGSYDDRGIDLIQLQNGNFVVASYSESYASPGIKSTMIMETNSLGIWQNGFIYYGNSDNNPSALVKENDTTFYIVGTTDYTTFGYSDIFVMKMGAVNINNTINIDSKYINKFCYTDLIEQENKTISLFPNPAKNYFTISSANNSKAEITMYDLLGNRVFVLSSTTNDQIFLPESIKNGNYILNIKLEDEILNKNIIVLR